MKLKETFETDVTATRDGFVIISQRDGSVRLSAPQIHGLLEWLKDGVGLGLDGDWNNGIQQEGE